MGELMKRVVEHLIDQTDRHEVQDQSDLWSPGSQADYFIDFRQKTSAVSSDADELAAQLRQARPAMLCQYAIGFYQKYRRASIPDDISRFLECAALLVDTQCQGDAYRGGWLYDAPSPYRSRRPWVSALAQGQALSVLSRAYSLSSGSSKYEAAARSAASLFWRSIEEGGVTSRDRTGSVCFEEYPSDPPSRVLNGWVFAWVGLREYADTFGDERAADLCVESLESLEKYLPRYDVGYWSRYDLFESFPMMFLANRFYHRLHVAQLRAMFRMVGRRTFWEYAERWNRYSNSTICNLRYALRRYPYKAACLFTGWR